MVKCMKKPAARNAAVFAREPECSAAVGRVRRGTGIAAVAIDGRRRVVHPSGRIVVAVVVRRRIVTATVIAAAVVTAYVHIAMAVMTTPVTHTHAGQVDADADMAASERGWSQRQAGCHEQAQNQ